MATLRLTCRTCKCAVALCRTATTWDMRPTIRNIDKSLAGTYLLIGLVAVGAAAGGYYLKVYKPKHEYDDEDEMEEDENESEDSESEKREVDDADEQEEQENAGTEVLKDEDFNDEVLEDEEEEQE